MAIENENKLEKLRHSGRVVAAMMRAMAMATRLGRVVPTRA
jgi:hypothetical protein